jgi:hypothetical protein
MTEKEANELDELLIPNSLTMAAMQEVQDMIDGKIPQKSYHSLDEMLEALHG